MVVAALGYFVDIYDLILFGIVRVESLKGIGYTNPTDIERYGQLLLDVQMLGLLIGGILWGIWGDRRGRLTVLFGSIIIYSTANLLNGAVSELWQYAILRFVAGIGLAGELGAGVTLVSEIMSREKRGIGTTIIATFGLLGAVVASLVGGYDWNLGIENWRVAYYVGGGLGLALLLLRINVFESGLFKSMKEATVRKGDFMALLTHPERLVRYLRCIGIGVPIWYMVGILIFFSPEITRDLHVQGTVNAPRAILLAYLGLSIGDLTCGLLSQWLKSRKRAVAIFMSLALMCTLFYLLVPGLALNQFYILSFLIGFSAGYWAVFVTIGAEQFGTNLRATVTTTVPNFVRGSLVPVALLYSTLGVGAVGIGRITAALITGILVFGFAYIALFGMKETFSKDLNYFEEL